MTLEHSRRWCANVMREHAKSFYLSTRILPRAKRHAVEALYGLFRTADDLADEPGPPDDQRLAALDETMEQVERAADGATGDAPWFAAVADAFARFPIDRRDVLRLIEACRGDVVPAALHTMDDLYAYSACVAGTVGRASMAILGAADEDSLVRGERLGVAMQYTNVLRDVEEDRLRGRSYLPFEDFPGEPVSSVMRQVALHARAYYLEAPVLAGRVPNDGSRAALLMTADIYQAILDRLERRAFDPTLGRAYVPQTEKLRRALACLVQSYVGFATIK
ncbi:MAG TPA: phytoene/squalene synthase family protein [Candidatus Aquilonibacter sp.]|nr:phytoene/squalene synthase family protein [Candidatus Aquilonibacter sp.]